MFREPRKEKENMDSIQKLNPPSTYMQDKARQIVTDYFNRKVDATDSIELLHPSDTFVLWFSKTLQNWKALVSTNIPDGKYYEITYDGDRNQAYLDVYVKLENVTVQDLAEETHPKP